MSLSPKDEVWKETSGNLIITLTCLRLKAHLYPGLYNDPFVILRYHF